LKEHGNLRNKKCFFSFAAHFKMPIKAKILKGVYELFYKYGVKSVRMEDIAKHLSMSKKTLYQVFSNKEEIVNCFIEEELAKSKAEIETIEKSTPDPTLEMIRLMEYLRRIFAEINPTMYYDIQKYHPNAWNKFRQFKENYIIRRIENNLRSGIEKGLYRSEINVLVLARLRVEQIDLGFDYNKFPIAQFDTAKVQMSLLDHFLYGIVTAKGYELIQEHKKSSTL